MGLNGENCKHELVEAMRARLGEHGDNVDLPDVQRSFAALGEGIFKIATERAKTVSDSGEDPPFWLWIDHVQGWLQELSDWQRSVAQVFEDWEPQQPEALDLKTRLGALPTPGDPPDAAPVRLAGRIE